MGTLSNPTASTPHVGQLIEAIRRDLADWMASRGGVVGVAQDPLAVLEILAGGAPRGWRATILWAGDESADARRIQAGTVTTALQIVVDANPGLTQRKDAAVFQESAGRPALTDLCAQLRGRALSWRFPTETVQDGKVYYRRTAPYSYQQALPLAAYQLEFDVTHVIPIPAETVAMTLNQSGEG